MAAWLPKRVFYLLRRRRRREFGPDQLSLSPGQKIHLTDKGKPAEKQGRKAKGSKALS